MCTTAKYLSLQRFHSDICTVYQVCQSSLTHQALFYKRTGSFTDALEFYFGTSLCELVTRDSDMISSSSPVTASLRLVGLALALFSNGLHGPYTDADLGFIIDDMRDVDPLDHFLNFIVEYNLFPLLKALLSLPLVAIDAFVELGLVYAVRTEGVTLILIFLEKQLAIESRNDLTHDVEYSPFTQAFEAALALQNIKIIDIFLRTGRDCFEPYRHLDWRTLVPLRDMGFKNRSSITGLQLEMVKHILDFQVSRDEICKNLAFWLACGKRIIRMRSGYLLDFLLKYLNTCHELQSELSDPRLDLCLTLLKGDVGRVRHLLLQGGLKDQNHLHNRICEGLGLTLSPRNIFKLADNSCLDLMKVLISHLREEILNDRDLVSSLYSSLVRCNEVQATDFMRELGLDPANLLTEYFGGGELEICKFFIGCGAKFRLEDLKKEKESLALEWALILDFSLRDKIRLEQLWLHIPTCDTPVVAALLIASLRIVGSESVDEETRWLGEVSQVFEPLLPDILVPLQTYKIIRRVFDLVEWLRILKWLLQHGWDFNTVLQHGPVTCLIGRFGDGELDKIERILRLGVYPSDKLLIHTCTCTSRVDHPEALSKVLQLMVDHRNATGRPFSVSTLTKGFNAIAAVIKTPTYNYDIKWDYESSDIAALRFLAKEGAAVDTWLRHALVHLAPHQRRFDCDISAVLFSGASPILVALHMKAEDLLEDLFARGFDINSPFGDAPSLTALQYVSIIGDTELIKQLLDHGANVNAPALAAYAATALQHAAARGFLQIAVDLLEAGADVNAPAAEIGGRTALEVAAENGRLEMVSLLVRNNHDPQKLRVDCKRAARLAQHRHHTGIAKMLQRHARKLSEELGLPFEDEIDSMCICRVGRWREPRRKCGEAASDELWRR